MSEPEYTEKYKHFNHHHELTEDHQVVDFGDGEFIANIVAVPLLKALNELGLKTRTHHVDETGGFVSILLDKDIRVEIKHVHEYDATRTKYNDRHEVLIMWNKPLSIISIPIEFTIPDEQPTDRKADDPV
jgi:hypothetical protein